MGGKRFRWIYFQLGQLALLSVAAFVAAIAVAVPASGTLPLTHLRFLEGAEMSVMLWIPSLLFWMLMKRGNSQPRADRYACFVVLFVTTASIMFAGFYGFFADAAVLKRHHPDFTLGSDALMRASAMALAIGLVGVFAGATLRNRNAFLVLFGFIGASSFCALLTRAHLVNPEAPWQRIGFDIVSRFADIGAFAIGIAAGIFVRELLRYRRRELRRRVT